LIEIGHVPEITGHVRRNTQLRFTKTGDANLETAYARHFVWPGKQGFKPLLPLLTRLEPAGSFDDQPRSLSPLPPEA